MLLYDGDQDIRERPNLGSVFGTLADACADDPGVIPNLRGRGMAHSALTQSRDLVSYAGYEQIIVGPAGIIAAEQIRDLTYKAASRSLANGPVPVTVLAARVNPALDEGLRYSKQYDNDPVRRLRAADKLAIRQERPYGLLLTPDGELAFDPDQYPGVEFNVIHVQQSANVRMDV